MEERIQTNHKDLDKTNNRLDNLEWVTPQENVQHAVANGRHGGRRQRLTDDQLRQLFNEIRYTRGQKILVPIAERYGLSVGYLCQLRRGMYRKDITCQPA